MEIYHQNTALKLFCMPATSFPAGVKEAFKKLERLLPTKEGRTFFGISHGSKDGSIIYKAAVLEAFDGEGTSYGLENFTLTQGDYLTETILNWQEKMEKFETVFKNLLADPRLDTNFPCVEWYKSDKEVMCMVRIIPGKK
jgi:hypothetical protein